MDLLAPIPVRTRVADLSISNQQLVEIAKALTLDCKVLMLDEPTAALTESEARRLFSIVRGLKARGISVVYISHRMAEIFSLCDRVTVFRDGRYVATDPIAAVSPDDVVRKMVGREITQLYPDKLAPKEAGRLLLSVEGLSDGRRFADIDLQLRAGEILGIGGLIGAGRSEIAQTICGLRPMTAGTVALDGKQLRPRGYGDAVKAGLVYLSEDRKGSGVFLDLPIAQNISALDLARLTGSLGLLDRRAEDRQARELTGRLGVRMAGIEATVSTLSGGNQQKVAIAKQLSVSPKVIIMDEPTRGDRRRRQGRDPPSAAPACRQRCRRRRHLVGTAELIGLCDRVMVVRDGRIAGELRAGELGEEAIMHAGIGCPEQFKPKAGPECRLGTQEKRSCMPRYRPQVVGGASILAALRRCAKPG